MKFAEFTDGDLDDLAEALWSASGEGAFDNRAMAQDLAREFKKRDRIMPLAYGRESRTPEPGSLPPDRWLAGIFQAG